MEFAFAKYTVLQGRTEEIYVPKVVTLERPILERNAVKLSSWISLGLANHFVPLIRTKIEQFKSLFRRVHATKLS